MQNMPCKIHSPALIIAHPDLQGLDRRFVCGFIGESKSRIAVSQFKGSFFVHRWGLCWLQGQICQNRLDIRYENVCLCVARGCLVVMLRNGLLMLTSLNHYLVPVCVSYHFPRIKTEANSLWGLMCWSACLILVSVVLVQVKRCLCVQVETELLYVLKN